MAENNENTLTANGLYFEDVEDEEKRDGVTRRIKIPSWDDIMFGKKDED